MTKYGRPSGAALKSKIWTMFGCRSSDMISASRQKRAKASRLPSRSGSRIFTAKRPGRRTCVAS